MAVVVGGDITEVSFNNPLQGAGFLYPVAGKDSKYDLGGFRGSDQPDVDGAGRLINKQNRTPWFFEVPISADMKNTREFDTICGLAESQEESTWTFTHVNGTIYRGKGVVVGKPELNGNDSTFTLKVAGGATLQQI